MNTSFLEYSKLILEKVSFDESLFRKEFHKAQTLLNKPERDELRFWVKQYHMLNDMEQEYLIRF